jgi:drug/metabolite transporter (DMT)-like permease
MPVWAAVFARIILGEKPSLARILALVLALSGLIYLVLGKGLDLGIAKLPGVALGLGSAVLFALGTVLTKRMPLGLPPSSSVAWQVGIGVAPLFIAALIFDPLDFSHVSALGVGLLIYGGVFALGFCYLSWFAALKMLPASLASLGTVITPVVGVLGAALFLGEPFGLREILALTLVLSGVVLAVRG